MSFPRPSRPHSPGAWQVGAGHLQTGFATDGTSGSSVFAGFGTPHRARIELATFGLGAIGGAAPGRGHCHQRPPSHGVTKTTGSASRAAASALTVAGSAGR